VAACTVSAVDADDEGPEVPPSSPQAPAANIKTIRAMAAAIRRVDMEPPGTGAHIYERNGHADGGHPDEGQIRTLEVMWPSRADRLSDDALLAALATGDDDASTVFVRRFQRRVFGLALAVTGEPAVAEDIAQQAFARAWQHATSYDARRGNVLTWLLTITRNAAIDTMRVRKPQPLDPLVLVELAPPSRAGDPSDAAVARDELARLRDALDTLPVEQRRAVLLATIGSRTSVEIASIEGVPVPTAKHRVQSGLRKLRRAVISPDAELEA
jgi:RNA polymerase sigma-70 factor (ECF subfamily)